MSKKTGVVMMDPQAEYSRARAALVALREDPTPEAARLAGVLHELIGQEDSRSFHGDGRGGPSGRGRAGQRPLVR